MHELQVDRDNYLKDGTSEAFLISLENKTFKGPIFSVGVTDCEAISPIYLIFHCRWTPKYNPTQHS